MNHQVRDAVWTSVPVKIVVFCPNDHRRRAGLDSGWTMPRAHSPLRPVTRMWIRRAATSVVRISACPANSRPSCIVAPLRMASARSGRTRPVPPCSACAFVRRSNRAVGDGNGIEFALPHRRRTSFHRRGGREPRANGPVCRKSLPCPEIVQMVRGGDYDTVTKVSRVEACTGIRKLMMGDQGMGPLRFLQYSSRITRLSVFPAMPRGKSLRTITS